MSLSRLVKVALDETRLMILGSQVLLGFQYQAFFREGFLTLPSSSKLLLAGSLSGLIASVSFLIAPSMQMRLVESGEDSVRLLGVVRRYAVAALLAIIFALAVDFHVLMEKDGYPRAAIVLPALFAATCASLWFVVPIIIKAVLMPEKPPMDMAPAKLEARVDQLLVEARVILPGVQALLGFQLIITFSEAFSGLSQIGREAHYFALGANTIAMTLLMAPASLHRITFSGGDDERFVRLGSAIVVIAPTFLAMALSADAFVVLELLRWARQWSLTASATLLTAMICIWYVWPLILRRGVRHGSH